MTQPLQTLYLSFLAERYQELADQAARQQGTAVQYLARLIEGETQRRHERPIVRRVAAAHFPVIKTLEPFNWSWPKEVNQAQVQNLFRLAFLKDQARVGFIGGVGLGNTHLATALGHVTGLLYGSQQDATESENKLTPLSIPQRTGWSGRGWIGGAGGRSRGSLAICFWR